MSSTFSLSADISERVQIRLLGLHRLDKAIIPLVADKCRAPLPQDAMTFQVQARIATRDDETIGLSSHTVSFEGIWASGALLDERVTLLPRYAEVPLDAYIELIVLATGRFSHGTMMLGRCRQVLFGREGKLKMGRYRLTLSPHDKVSSLSIDTSPPSSPPSLSPRSSLPPETAETSLALIRSYDRGEMPRIPWLDALVRPKLIETLRPPDASLSKAVNLEGWMDRDGLVGQWMIDVELPLFPHDVYGRLTPHPNPYIADNATTLTPILLHHAADLQDASTILQSLPLSETVQSTSDSWLERIPYPLAPPNALLSIHSPFAPPLATRHELPWPAIFDPELALDPLCELFATKLTAWSSHSPSDAKSLVPSSAERRRLLALLALPPARALSHEERSLLWTFRYFLSHDPRALPRVLQAVDWRHADTTNEALSLLDMWAPLDPFDALELLSGDYVHDEIRSHAVECLARGLGDEDYKMLLPQLVQALRYEVKRDDKIDFDAVVQSWTRPREGEVDVVATPSSSSPSSAASQSLLEALLVSRAVSSVELASLLHWHLTTLWEDPRDGPLYVATHNRLYERLTTNHPTQLDAIRRQRELLTILDKIASDIKGMRATAERRAERLKFLIGPGGPYEELLTLQAPLPTQPDLLIQGVVVEECSVFKSAMVPLLIAFRIQPAFDQGADEAPLSAATAAMAGSSSGTLTPSGSADRTPPHTPTRRSVAGRSEARHWSIYKQGDDLRQDQLCIQLIELMDNMLKRQGLDLCLTPYRVLATSPTDGLVDFVDAHALSKVLATHRSINRYLAHRYPRLAWL